ncbi:M23 family metallopeptidase [Arsenicicoccus dermatophilus]|uniref:M23 family metallopeptidase n=1 Tax=Arsenicicoccus dermatophilus TaxID=1076331 RepID=UPI001F4D1BA3|nr:M23 family metallopeptidase [Arsenicicoccus dermatophilus]MCH8612228.1 M23 family metallopeptidase [Arsenicicoccus dermatophilus]
MTTSPASSEVLAGRRPRHRAEPARPGARRVGMMGAAATLATGVGATGLHQLTGRAQAVEGPVTLSMAPAAAPEAAAATPTATGALGAVRSARTPVTQGSRAVTMAAPTALPTATGTTTAVALPPKPVAPPVQVAPLPAPATAAAEAAEAIERAIAEATTTPTTGTERPTVRKAAGAHRAPTRGLLGLGRTSRTTSRVTGASTWVLPVDAYRLTSRFGARWGGTHHGLDFACPVGTPVRSLSDGVVTDVRDGARVYGRYVDVTFEDGTLARYGHLSQLDVKVGQKVSAGEVLGLSGNEGRSTGPHLHLEIHLDGNPSLSSAVDPVVEFLKRGLSV